MTAFETGQSVPDVDLGMRGEATVERNGVVTLHDPVLSSTVFSASRSDALPEHKGIQPALGYGSFQHE